jgi:hypothetical protein
MMQIWMVPSFGRVTRKQRSCWLHVTASCVVLPLHFAFLLLRVTDHQEFISGRGTFNALILFDWHARVCLHATTKPMVTPSPNGAVATHLQDQRFQQAYSMGSAHAPISTLPDELVGSLFLLCGPEWSTYEGRDILSFSHVCRWWRQLALSMPALWTKPWLHPKLALEWISRAGDRPVDIVWMQEGLLHRPTHNSLEAIELQAIGEILAHRSPRKLIIDGEHDLLIPIVQSRAARIITEHLEILDIGLNPGNRDDEQWILPFSNAQIIPHKLRTLGLHGCHVQPDSILFANLTTVSISSDNAEPWSFHSFVNMLKHAPRLEDAHFRMVIQDESIPVVSGIPPAEHHSLIMHHLKSLRFEESLEAFLALVFYMRAPLLSQIEVRDFSPGEANLLELYPSALAEIVAHAGQSNWGPLHSVEVYIAGDEMWQHVSALAQMGADARAEVEVETADLDETVTARWLENVAQRICVDTVTCFSFTIDNLEWTPAGAGSWAAIFARMPNLAVLKGVHKGAYHLLEALAMSAPVDALPALTTLVLDSTDLMFARPPAEDAVGPPPCTLFWLFTYTNMRVRAGRPLQRLELCTCGVRSSSMDTVEQVQALQLPELGYPPSLELVVKATSSQTHGAVAPWHY